MSFLDEPCCSQELLHRTSWAAQEGTEREPRSARQGAWRHGSPCDDVDHAAQQARTIPGSSFAFRCSLRGYGSERPVADMADKGTAHVC